MQHAAEVIVIGAGVSGLAAADCLTQAGVSVVVVEARDRIGGRIWSDRSHGLVELGAEFIHGQRAATWSMLNPYKVPMVQASLLGTIPFPQHRWCDYYLVARRK